MSCTGVLTQVLRECCPKGWTHDIACQKLMMMRAQIGIGCNGVTFLPYLGGERTPNWPHATGALLGLNSQNMNNNNNNGSAEESDDDDTGSHHYLGLLWYRACMEAITFCLADTLQYFPEGSRKLNKLYVVGGGAKNPLWRQMIADVLQCPLAFPVEAESAALGAAFQAGAAAKGIPVEEYVARQKIELEPTVVEPNPENFHAYAEALDRYRRYGQKLFG